MIQPEDLLLFDQKTKQCVFKRNTFVKEGVHNVRWGRSPGKPMASLPVSERERRRKNNTVFTSTFSFFPTLFPLIPFLPLAASGKDQSSAKT